MTRRPSPPVVPRRLVIPAAPTAPDSAPVPLFLRAPWIAALWGLTLLTLVAALALARVRLPRRVKCVAVAVRAEADSVEMLLLLPPAAGPHVRPGQRATLDRGRAGTVTLTITGIERRELDARLARRRFPDSPSVLAHLDAPKLVARLGRCTATGCLTAAPGASFAAVASMGTRSLASYVLPRS